MQKRCKGSITIFSLLSFMLVAATLLTLIEGARVLELHRLARLQTEVALEAFFGNYNSHLWQEYHLLGTTKTKAEEILTHYGNGRYDGKEDGLNILLFQVEESRLSDYTLMTDGRGQAYVATVSNYMKDNLLYEVAKELYSRYESILEIQESSELDMTLIDEALEGLREMEKEKSSKTVGETRGVYNPLEVIGELLSGSLLDLAIGDEVEISKTKMELEKTLSHRELNQGTKDDIGDSGWLEKILLQQYILTYFSNYSQKQKNHYLSYEVEYLIGGKSTDKANLAEVVSQLLGLREVANFLYLTTNTTRMSEAKGIALALVGSSLNPVLVELVTFGILAAWAYGESILDVRAIMAGKRIPLLKNSASWTLGVKNIGDALSEGVMSRETPGGLSYEDYLGVLLLFQSEKTLAMRAMDAQEYTLWKNCGEEKFRMDELVVNAQVEMIYSYYPVFASFEEIESGGWKNQISVSATYGY